MDYYKSFKELSEKIYSMEVGYCYFYNSEFISHGYKVVKEKDINLDYAISFVKRLFEKALIQDEVKAYPIGSFNHSNLPIFIEEKMKDKFPGIPDHEKNNMTLVIYKGEYKEPENYEYYIVAYLAEDDSLRLRIYSGDEYVEAYCDILQDEKVSDEVRNYNRFAEALDEYEQDYEPIHSFIP